MTKGRTNAEPTIRSAGSQDAETVVSMLLETAGRRAASNPGLWRIAADAAERIRIAFAASLNGGAGRPRQFWKIAEFGGTPVGVAQAMLLPVPPIYAGEFGDPGLILDDVFLRADAPRDTAGALIGAMETRLRRAGARILIAASSGALAPLYAMRGYQPLTHYLARTGLGDGPAPDSVRPATENDLPGIVAQSRWNRQLLHGLHRFWKPHPEADSRFRHWMEKSLTLPDRDMAVADSGRGPTGYIISQPATPLHVPAAHPVSSLGFIDDFFEQSLENPFRDGKAHSAARALLSAAEASLAARGNDAALVVCPATWSAKKRLLEAAGYETALTWYIRDGSTA